MPGERFRPDLFEQLSEAQLRIEQLEAALAKARLEQATAAPVVLHPPSFILQSITDAFVAVDQEFRYIWVNPEAERLMNLSAADILGKSIWELFPEAVESLLYEKSHEALAQKKTISFDNFVPHLNRWFYNKIYPTNENGLAIYWREITEQKVAQADLRRQALMLDQVHDSIITSDLNGIITRWSRGAAKVFGYEAEEVVGQSVALLYFEEDRPSIESRVLQPLLRDGELEVELRNRRKSGEECFIRLSLSLIRNEAGEPYAMLGVATDVTGQRRAEQALRASETRQSIVLNAVPNVVYITDPHGKTESVNRHWEEYSGIAAEQCFGFDWISWIHPDDAGPLIPLWIESVNSGRPFDTEYRLRNAKGEYRWHLSRAVPVRGEDGTIVNWVGTLTDIHDQKTVEAALRISEERLRSTSQELEAKAVQSARANEDLLHFAYAASHDLRAPLRTMVTFSQLLQLRYKPILDDDGRSLLEEIVRGGSRMTNMLADLLQFATIAGSDVPATDLVFLEQPLGMALQNLQSGIHESGAAITHDPLPAVLGDSVRLVQLFQNLIGDAIKYRNEARPLHVHISSERRGDEWVVRISDNGIGFDPAYAETIFGVFRRLHGPEIAGTGIGLAICKRIVEQMSGRIWAEGSLGVGATIFFAIPVVADTSK